MQPLRIGKIAFTNILPIYHYFDIEGLNAELVYRVPSELNRRLANKEIDISPISSFAFAQNASEYLLMPNLSISATGAVRSVFLFSKTASLKELDGKKVALTNTSATSNHLLKILLEKFERVRPEYFTAEPHLCKMMEQAQAAVIIGDHAIQAYWDYAKDYHVFDLSELWYQYTGLSMVFAVWAVRKEVLDSKMEELEEIYFRFMRAKERGVKQIQPIIYEAMNRLGGTYDFWKTYYHGLCYDLGEQQINGLKTYYQYAKECGFLMDEVKISMLDLPCIQSMR